MLPLREAKGSTWLMLIFLGLRCYEYMIVRGLQREWLSLEELSLYLPRIQLCPPLPFPSNRAEDDIRSKSRLLWQSIRLKVRLLYMLEYIYIYVIACFFPHGQLYVVFPWSSSFDNVGVAIIERRRQRIENYRWITSNTLYREVL